MYRKKTYQELTIEELEAKLKRYQELVELFEVTHYERLIKDMCTETDPYFIELHIKAYTVGIREAEILKRKIKKLNKELEKRANIKEVA